MTDTGTQEVQKREVRDLAEQTRPGRVFTPEVDILEDEDKIVLLADLPGVPPENLNIDLRESVLSISGRVETSESDGEETVIREYDSGTFYRQFTVTDLIDQAKIDAHLKDGVLRLVLPKAEAARPRRIAIRTT